MLKNLNLPLQIAEGTRAKLDFDFACQRARSFGEYHVHGTVNEILCSNLDPIRHRIHSGFAHPDLQTPGAVGRRREVDFAVSALIDGSGLFYAEVKWAGSSHCTQENLLRDVCRLQIIKNAEPTAECVFILAGSLPNIKDLFSKGILQEGTSSLLHRDGKGVGLAPRGRNKRKKRFVFADHADGLQGMLTNISCRLPLVPDHVSTCLTYSAQSAPASGRFQALVWSIGEDRHA